ncbi:MAG: hypothetical protein K2X90_04375 [Candidatus Babeliaceae bacterium]|nr:hypothetical protein [Candidatus Babeliaceae bacterium]
MKKYFFAYSLFTQIQYCAQLPALQVENTSTSAKDNIADHPLMSHYNMCILYNLALRLSDTIDRNFRGKKQVLVGLGQSPAYLLEMIKMIDNKKSREDRRYISAAFSGRKFLFDNEDGRIKKDPFLAERFNKVEPYYSRYLDSIGLSKEELSKHDTEFIVLEVCRHCTGLASFFDFFYTYSKKPSAYYLQSSDFKEVRFLDSNLKKIKIDTDEERLMVGLANSDSYKDRIVAQFSYYKWETINPLAFQKEENAQLIIEEIKKFVESPDINC